MENVNYVLLVALLIFSFSKGIPPGTGSLLGAILIVMFYAKFRNCTGPL